jgi:hypothetical protein
MFRKNDQHLQEPLFSSIDSLPDRQRKRLDDSWAKTYYDQVFVRIDEEPFAVLYVDEPSRPNVPINVLVSLDTLKSGHGWSDEEMYDHFSFDVQVRYALGYRDLSEGHFAIRTVYNFRERVTRHMEETGENLYERAFEHVTDEQLAAFELKTGQLRVDSTQIASNIRALSRLQLLVEVLQRVHRMLNQDDQQRYREEFAPYTQGSSGQYTYRVKVSETDEHLRCIGELMARLVCELSATYAEDETYQILQRVFQEHFVVESNPTAPSTVAGDNAAQQTHLRAKEGQELSASSLQSPDDPEATYRQKHGRDYKGYVTNLTRNSTSGPPRSW